MTDAQGLRIRSWLDAVPVYAWAMKRVAGFAWQHCAGGHGGARVAARVREGKLGLEPLGGRCHRGGGPRLRARLQANPD